MIPSTNCTHFIYSGSDVIPPCWASGRFLLVGLTQILHSGDRACHPPAVDATRLLPQLRAAGPMCRPATRHTRSGRPEERSGGEPPAAAYWNSAGVNATSPSVEYERGQRGRRRSYTLLVFSTARRAYSIIPPLSVHPSCGSSCQPPWLPSLRRSRAFQARQAGPGDCPPAYRPRISQWAYIASDTQPRCALNRCARVVHYTS